MVNATFVCSGLAFPEDKDPLGIWDLARPAATPLAAAREGTPQGLVWDVELPPVANEAKAVLRVRRLELEAREEALAVAAERLARFDPAPTYRVYADAAEAKLLAEVQALRSSTTAYGMREDVTSVLREVYARCEALLVQFRRLVQFYARVETEVDGRDVALTAVDWTGDYRTAWMDNVTPADMQLHLDAVRLALASRLAWLRLITIVASGALDLASKASIPGGQVLLMPAVYQFVRDVLEEMERSQIRMGLGKSQHLPSSPSASAC